MEMGTEKTLRQETNCLKKTHGLNNQENNKFDTDKN